MTTAMAIDCHIWALLVDKTLPNSTDSNVIADWVRAQMSTPQARNAVNTIPIDVSRFSRELVFTNPMPAAASSLDISAPRKILDPKRKAIAIPGITAWEIASPINESQRRIIMDQTTPEAIPIKMAEMAARAGCGCML